MDDTLGIDCPKAYLFDRSAMAETPGRKSTDFTRGIVGDLQPKKKIRMHDPDDSFEGCITRSQSTPRRSARKKKTTVRKCVPIGSAAAKPAAKLAAKPAAKPSRTATTNLQTKPRTGPRAIPPTPKSNRTLELRKKAAASRGKEKVSNAVVMKPHFQKPKLFITVPKTPELVRRLKAQHKRNNPHIKSFIQREEEEVQEMRKYMFKAAPAPILKAARSKAQQLPTRVRSEKKVTKAVTPKMTKGKKRKFEEEQINTTFKAQPAPVFKKSANVVKNDLKKKVVMKPAKPFSFDKKYTDPNANRQKLIEQNMKEMKEKATFKAKPYFKPNLVQKKEAATKENRKPVQKSKQFMLPGELISQKKKAAFQKKIQDEQEQMRAKANNFRASTIGRRAAAVNSS